MMKLTPLALLLALLLCGFGPADEGKEPAPEPEAEEEEEAEDVIDTSKSTIDMYLNGTIKATYWVTVHADPKAGQYWQTVSEAYGTKTTNRWQVAKVDGTTAIIENQMKSVSEYAKSDYVLAYEVDVSVKMPEETGAKFKPNVTRAWVGRPGKAGTEIKVMEVPEPIADGGAAADYEITEEDFTNLEIAGGKWSGKKMTMKGDGWEFQSWTATNGWFGGVVKSEVSGMVTELKAFGDDAKALLELPEDEEEGKKEEKKDEKTPDKEND